MKKNLFNLFVLLCLSLTMASCVGDDDPTQYFTSHFVIEGSNPNYVLYSREGYTVNLDPTSVASITNNKGFGSNKRGYFTISYLSDDVVYKPVEGTNSQTVTINNAKLVGGSYTTVLETMSMSEAEADNLTLPDSIFTVSSIYDCWMQRGYLNVIIDAYYSINGSGAPVFPTTNIAYRDDAMKENEITFDILYNRHTKKDAPSSSSIGRFITSYYMPDLVYQVPGSDSITVNFKAEGATPVKIKIGRR